jgi:predicted dehydrogenase
MSLAEADEVIGVFERHGTPSGVFRNFLHFPGWIKAFDLVDQGAIGTPRQATIVGTSIWAPGLGASDGKLDGPGWRPRASVSGGGIFIDYGIHTVYLARRFLGGTQPDRVIGSIASLGEASGDVEDRGTMVLEWRDGRRAVLDMSWGSGTTGATSVQGTDGSLHVHYPSGWASPHNVADGVSILRGIDEEEVHAVEWRRNPIDWYYGGAIKEFAVGLREPPSRAPTLADGRADLEVILAAYESAALGRPVDLPLVASDPVYQHGALGLRELDLPDYSPVAENGLYRSSL